MKRKDTTTGDLFFKRQNDLIKGMVRNPDHSTSIGAAEKVVDGRSALQLQVLKAFEELGAMTDGELEALPRFSGYAYSTVRKRRTELVQSGALVETGERRDSASGTPMKVWRLR